VTIITDGYENASHEFSQTAIKSLIDSYKEQGWQFTYIGADHDVEQVAYSLHINHSLQFDKSEEGTQRMFAHDRRSRSRWMDRMKSILASPDMSVEEKDQAIREANESKYF